MSATGRMGREAVRGSQLTGAPIKSSSGSDIGTISDTIVNPASGRLEFAVISLNGNAAGATTSTTSGASGKQVAVPWMLLRPSSTSGTAGVSGTTSSTRQPSFVFTAEATKLESAPAFDPNTDLTQPNWRQSVFSYFGVSGRRFGGTGGAETPGGTSTGSQRPESSSGQR